MGISEIFPPSGMRVHQILEGTNEIMRVIIGREMFRQ
jgi:alkylation response protein AidB-like acyl-CoA dehydrogenase